MLATQAHYRPLSKAALARRRSMAISTVSRVNKVRPAPYSLGPLLISPQLKSRHGAPAQPTQSSRKGKKAWRKNVDLVQVEDTLEGLRDEERITGCVRRH